MLKAKSVQTDEPLASELEKLSSHKLYDAYLG